MNCSNEVDKNDINLHARLLEYSLYGAAGLNVVQLLILTVICIRTRCNCCGRQISNENQNNDDKIEPSQVASKDERNPAVVEYTNTSITITENSNVELYDDVKAFPTNIDKQSKYHRFSRSFVCEPQESPSRHRHHHHHDHHKSIDQRVPSQDSQAGLTANEFTSSRYDSGSSFTNSIGHKPLLTFNSTKTTKVTEEKELKKEFNVIFMNESSKPLAPSELRRLCKLNNNSKSCATLPSRFKPIRRNVLPRPPDLILLKPILDQEKLDKIIPPKLASKSLPKFVDGMNDFDVTPVENAPPIPGDEDAENFYESMSQSSDVNYDEIRQKVDTEIIYENDDVLTSLLNRSYQNAFDSSHYQNFNALASSPPSTAANTTIAIMENSSLQAATGTPASKRKPMPLQRTTNMTKSQPNLTEMVTFNI